MTGKSQWLGILGENRLELELADGKPLYTKTEAVTEANRCLYCYDAPCITACPTSIDIPSFIRKISTDNLRGSAKTIFKANMLGYSCARVCPVEVLCAGACVYNDYNEKPIEIGRLQRYATEHALAGEATTGRKLFEPKPKTGKRVALIGAGPASLACAAYLALEGVEAVVYDKADVPGGLNTTGVAPYKLHSEGSLKEVDWLVEHGVTLKLGVEIGKEISLAHLQEDFDAVFIGMGLGKDNSLGLPGGEGAGYLGATQLIARLKNDSAFRIPDHVKEVVIIGGGNTAIDMARELAMLGSLKVTMAYRRSEAAMSGYRHEMKGARIYGVGLVENATPVEVLRTDGLITGLKVAIAGEETPQVMPCQWIVEAIGQEKQGGLFANLLELDGKGRIQVNSSRETSCEGIYAGGDCINGGKEVVNAAEDGREAAFAMLRSWGIRSELEV